MNHRTDSSLLFFLFHIIVVQLARLVGIALPHKFGDVSTILIVAGCSLAHKINTYQIHHIIYADAVILGPPKCLLAVKCQRTIICNGLHQICTKTRSFKLFPNSAG